MATEPGYSVGFKISSSYDKTGTDQAKQSLSSMGEAVKTTEGRMGGLKATTVAWGMALYDIAKGGLKWVVGSLSEMVTSALAAERANLKLDATLRSVGAYTPELATQMRDLASSIKKDVGGSGTEIKNLVSGLLAIGVSAQNMDGAVRSVKGLEALGIEGSTAMRAVARALDGDIEGFKRFSPGVREATDTMSAFDAAQKMINAGQEQLKANLKSTGGGWDEFTGKIKEVRTKLILAVIEGLNLGQTFSDAGDKIAAFVESDSFKGFTKSLKDGAAFAKDIFNSLTTKGQFTDTLSDVGDLIVASFREGADYVGEAIKNALTPDWLNKKDPNAKIVPVIGVGFGGVGNTNTQAEESKNHGASGSWDETPKTSKQIVQAMKEKFENQKRINEVQAMAAENEAADLNEKAVLDKKAIDKQKTLAEGKAKAAEKAIENEHTQDAIDGLNLEILQTTKDIKKAADQEAEARQDLADTERKIADLAAQTASDYIKNHEEQAQKDKATEKQNNKMERRLEVLAGKENKPGLHMSKKDKETLALARKKDQELLDNQNKAIWAKNQAEDFQIAQEKMQEEILKKQERIAKATEEIAKTIKAATSESGGL